MPARALDCTDESLPGRSDGVEADDDAPPTSWSRDRAFPTPPSDANFVNPFKFFCLAIALFPYPFLFEHDKSVRRFSVQLPYISAAQFLPGIKRFQEVQALRSDHGLWAAARTDPAAYPHGPSSRLDCFHYPGTSPVYGQAALSARIAFPSGWPRELKMKCDQEFFSSSFVSPISLWMASIISELRVSGPLSTIALTQAGSLSIKKP